MSNVIRYPEVPRRQQGTSPNRAAPAAPKPKPPQEFANSPGKELSGIFSQENQGEDNAPKRRSTTSTRILVHAQQKPSERNSSSFPSRPPSSLLARISLLPASIAPLIKAAAAQAKRPLACQKWTCFQVTEFLDACGLGAYSQLFEEQGVDGPILLELSPDQIERGMHMDNGMHMISLITAVQLLMEGKIKRVDEWEWTCTRTSEWLSAKGLDCLVDRFQEFAVHGGVLFQLTQDEFVSELGVNNALILMSLMTSIDRAKQVGPVKFGDSIADWSLSQVKVWLEGLSLAHLHSVFRMYGINGSLLLHLDRDMMTHEMGLTEIQAMVLEKAIAKLQKQAAQEAKSWFPRRASRTSHGGGGGGGKSNELPYALPYPQNSSAHVNAARRPTLI